MEQHSNRISPRNCPPHEETPQPGKGERTWEEPKLFLKITPPIAVHPHREGLSPETTGAFISRNVSSRQSNNGRETPPLEEPPSQEKNSPLQPSTLATKADKTIEIRPSKHRNAPRWQVGKSNGLTESVDSNSSNTESSGSASLNNSQAAATPYAQSPVSIGVIGVEPTPLLPKPPLWTSTDRFPMKPTVNSSGNSGAASAVSSPGTSAPSGPTTATVSLRGLRPQPKGPAPKLICRATYDPESVPKDCTPIFPPPSPIASVSLDLPTAGISTSLRGSTANSLPQTSVVSSLSTSPNSLNASSESFSGNASGEYLSHRHHHHHLHLHHHHHHHQGHPTDHPSSSSSLPASHTIPSPPKSPGPQIVPAFTRPISPYLTSPPTSRPISPHSDHIPAVLSRSSNDRSIPASPPSGVSPRPTPLPHSATAPHIRATSPYRWEVVSPSQSPPRGNVGGFTHQPHQNPLPIRNVTNSTLPSVHHTATSPPNGSLSASKDLLTRVPLELTDSSKPAQLPPSGMLLRTSGVASPPVSPRAAAAAAAATTTTAGGSTSTTPTLTQSSSLASLLPLSWSSSTLSLLTSSSFSAGAAGGTMILRRAPLLGVSLLKNVPLSDLKIFLVAVTEWIEDKLSSLAEGEREEPFGVDHSECPESLRNTFSKEWVDGDLLFPGMELPSVIALLKKLFRESSESMLGLDVCEKILLHGELNHTLFRGSFLQGMIMSQPAPARITLLNLVPFFSRILPRLKLTFGMSPVEILANAFGSDLVRAASSSLASPSQLPPQPSVSASDLRSLGIRTLLTLLNHADLWLPERESDWMEMKDGQLMVVAAAKVSSLPLLLLAPQYRDVELSDLVIALHAQYFLDSNALLDRFIELHRMTAEERLPEWRNSIQLRLLVLIYTWIKSATSQQPKSVDTIRERLRDWLRTVATFSDSARNMQQMTLGLLAHERLAEDTSHAAFARAASVGSNLRMVRTDFSVLDALPMDVASVLTMIDFDLYRSIPTEEFLTRAFMKEVKSPRWHEMVAQWNRTTHLVQHEILRKEASSTTRSSVITKWILICEACLKMNNFSAASAILGGLNAAPISRLALSWEKVPSKNRKQFKDLMRIFDHSHNYRTYRETIATLYPPFIPYLALFGKWLFAIEENNVTFLTDRPEYVNVSKLRNLWKLLRELRRSRTGEFRLNFDPSSETYLWIRTASIPSNEDLFYEQSLKCEPQRKTAA